MSKLDTALSDVATALDLSAIAQAETGIGGPLAAEIIMVLAAATHTLQGVTSGHVTVEQAQAQLAMLLAGLAHNDAAADAAIAARFPAP